MAVTEAVSLPNAEACQFVIVGEGASPSSQRMARDGARVGGWGAGRGKVDKGVAFSCHKQPSDQPRTTGVHVHW